MRIILWGIAGLSVLCLAIAVVSGISNQLLSGPPEASDRLLLIDKARLAEVRHLRQALGEQVWPGFGQENIPLLVWNREWSFLTGLEAQPVGWQAVPQDDFQGEVYYRQVSDDPQNFAVPVGEAWAASLAMKSETDDFLIQYFHDFLPPVIEQVFFYCLLI